MKTVLAFETMEKLLPYVSDILGDELVSDFKRVAAKKEKNSGEMISVLLPLFTSKKRESLLNILSIVTGKTIEAINDQDFTETVKDMKNGFVGEMITFFICAVRMVANA